MSEAIQTQAPMELPDHMPDSRPIKFVDGQVEPADGAGFLEKTSYEVELVNDKVPNNQRSNVTRILNGPSINNWVRAVDEAGSVEDARNLIEGQKDRILDTTLMDAADTIIDLAVTGRIDLNERRNPEEVAALAETKADKKASREHQAIEDLPVGGIRKALRHRKAERKHRRASE